MSEGDKFDVDKTVALLLPNAAGGQCADHTLLRSALVAAHEKGVEEAALDLAFYKVVKRIRFLVETGARHKRGFLLSDVTTMAPLIHMAEEVTEVMWEEEKQRPIRERVYAVQSVEADPEDVLKMNIADGKIKNELDDALGCWLHYVIRKRFSLRDLLERYNDSLDQDFPGAFPDPEVGP